MQKAWQNPSRPPALSASSMRSQGDDMDPITVSGKHNWFPEVMESVDAQSGIYSQPNWPTRRGVGFSLWFVTNASVPGKEWWPHAS